MTIVLSGYTAMTPDVKWFVTYSSTVSKSGWSISTWCATGSEASYLCCKLILAVCLCLVTCRMWSNLLWSSSISALCSCLLICLVTMLFWSLYLDIFLLPAPRTLIWGFDDSLPVWRRVWIVFHCTPEMALRSVNGEQCRRRKAYECRYRPGQLSDLDCSIDMEYLFQLSRWWQWKEVGYNGEVWRHLNEGRCTIWKVEKWSQKEREKVRQKSEREK
jgi:hypothetical protein